MHFIQIIYCNNKPLVLTDNAEAYVAAHPQAAQYQIFAHSADAIKHIEEGEGAIIENPSHEIVIKELQKLYAPIDAGGGVVLNEKGQLLMIHRKGKWDLPKGKRDKGEAIEHCALREVSEETGLQQLTLGEKLCDTYHLYNTYGKNQLKHTTWYRMQGLSTDTLQPQAEENIEEARWVAPADIAPLAAQSYEAIRDVLHKAGFKW